MIFDKNTLEKHVPALRSATAEIAERVRPFVLAAAQELARQTPLGEEGEHTPLLHRAAYLWGAYRATSSLDLLATSAGFAVVSNDHQAPASAHRVAALRESLRQESSQARDDLLRYLLAEEEQGGEVVAFAYHHLLLYCPSLAREAGVVDAQGRMWHEEYHRLLPLISIAERLLLRTIGRAAVDMLRLALYRPIEQRSPEETAALALCFSCLSRYVQLAQGGDEAPATAFASLGQDMEDTDLPEYLDSPERLAAQSPAYENQTDHASFFFA